MTSRLRNWWVTVQDEANGTSARHARRGSGGSMPARLTDDDIISFEIAVEERERQPVHNRAALVKLLRAKNFVRWHRMQSDFKWAQRIAKRHGYNPEEVRWLLGPPSRN